MALPVGKQINKHLTMRLKYRRTVDKTFAGKNLLNFFPNVSTNVSDAIPEKSTGTSNHMLPVSY